MDRSLKYVECFKSIQGEGYSSGRVCFFIRLAGCNLRCKYCDTVYARGSLGKGGSLAFFFDMIEREKTDLVCITGGEPLLQLEGVEEFCKVSKMRGLEVEIETNGSIRIEDSLLKLENVRFIVDIKLPCSGEENSFNWLNLAENLVKSGKVWYKFVTDGSERDLAMIESLQSEYKNIVERCFISPVWNSDYKRVAEGIISGRIKGRLQIQLHKVLGIR